MRSEGGAEIGLDFIAFQTPVVHQQRQNRPIRYFEMRGHIQLRLC